MTTFRRVHTIYINNLASTVNTDYAQFEVYTFMVIDYLHYIVM